MVIDGLYEVEEIIGEGGMGMVFRVAHREWDLDMAVKMPLPELLQEKSQLERFVREAETWIDLGVHPNIVQCWFVRLHEGMPLLFLDFLAGGSLKQWFEDGLIVPGDWSTILDLVIQAVDGLNYAHSRGVIHRDVKPANLLVRGADRVCVTDFGIVKVLANASTGPSEQERAMMMAAVQPGYSLPGGTAEYAAPEQWDGTEVGPTLDIYAIGVILYEFCTGQRPFVAPDTAGGKTSLRVIRSQHQHKPPVPPREVRTDLPTSLDAVIMACLEKDPRSRPQSMEELRSFLVDIYQEATGKRYPREIPHASEQRAGALNNRAVSLWNLGKREQALDAWKQACRIDAHHPEALYNRSVTLWRLGKLPDHSVIERLQMAERDLELGYFLLECGKPKQATEAIQRALEDEQMAKLGRTHRALGDAFMYQEQFGPARKSYGEALKTMPKDEATLLRKRLAEEFKREEDSKNYFPRATAVSSFRHSSPVQLLHVTPEEGYILVGGQGWLECWHPVLKSMAWVISLPGEVPRFESDKTRLYAMDCQTPRIWNLADGTLIWEGEVTDRLLALDTPGRMACVAGPKNWIMDLDTQNQLCVLEGAAVNLTSGTFISAEEKLVTGDEDGNLSVWEARSGTQVVSGRVHDGPILSTLAVRGGRMALTVSPGDPARFSDLRKAKALVDVPQQGTPVKAEIDPSESYLLLRLDDGSFTLQPMGGKVLLSGSGPAHFMDKGLIFERQGQVAFWSFEDGWIRRRWAVHQQNLNVVNCDIEARYLLTGSEEGMFEWWHFDEKYRTFELEHLVTRSHTHVEAESSRRAFETFLGQAKLFVDSGQRESAYRTLAAGLNIRGYAKDQRALSLKAQLYGQFARVSLKSIWERRPVELSERVRQALLFGENIVVLSTEGRVTFFDEETIVLPISDARAIHLPGSESCLLVSNERGEVTAWSPDGKQLTRLTLESPAIRIASDRSGRYLVAATKKGYLQLVDLRSQKVLRSLKDQISPNRVVAASKDGNIVLSGPKLQVWKMSEGRALDGEHGRSQVVTLDVADKGQFALSSDRNNEIQLWRVGTGEDCQKYTGHKGNIVLLKLWEHLGVVVSGSADGTLIFWELAEGTVIRQLDVHPNGMIAGWASDNGRFVVTAGEDNLVRLWELEWDLATDRPQPTLEERYAKTTFGKLGSLFRRS